MSETWHTLEGGLSKEGQEGRVIVNGIQNSFGWKAHFSAFILHQIGNEIYPEYFKEFQSIIQVAEHGSG